MKKTFLHTYRNDALEEFDATEIALKLNNKELSCTEVTEAAIKRAQKINPDIHAIEVDCFDQALERCAAKPKGFFTCVPTFLKDNSALTGFATQHGSQAFKAKKDTVNGLYTQQFLEQGFNVIGKSRMPEFGFNATTEPDYQDATRNPWNTDYSTGGSSGGAAALVAAGVVPVRVGDAGEEMHDVGGVGRNGQEVGVQMVDA